MTDVNGFLLPLIYWISSLIFVHFIHLMGSDECGESRPTGRPLARAGFLSVALNRHPSNYSQNHNNKVVIKVLY